MKFGLLVVAAAAAGVIGVAVMPATMLEKAASATRTAGSQIAQVKLVDLNPLRALYDWEMTKATTPQTPESLGFKPAPVTVTSFPTLQPYQGMNTSPGFQNGQYTAGQSAPR
jgi:hypothetical protein